MSNRYQARHKGWDHVGNITPLVEHSESDFPHFQGVVAPWLPINGASNNVSMGFMSRYDKKMEDYKVISSGKVVALDATGYLVPRGVGINWASAGSSDVVLEYTALDVQERVTDLGTGQFVTAAKTYTKSALTTQLKEMGLLDVNASLDTFIGNAIGLVRQDCFMSAGPDLDNPSTYRYHNYKMQHQVAVLCDYVVRLPHVPSSANTVTVPAFNGTAFSLANLNDANSAGVWGTLARFAAQMDRYDGITNANAVGLALRRTPCAKHTTRTPLTITSSSVDITSTVLVHQTSGVAELSSVGDYFFDHEVGVLWFYEEGANALPSGLTASDVVAYYDYTLAPTSVSTYTCVVGNVKPGDFLVCDGNSNLTTADYSTAIVEADVAGSIASEGSPQNDELAGLLSAAVEIGARRSTDILGQALTVILHPRDLLDRVRTAYTFLGIHDQMPGSASGGYPDTVTYSGAADREVIINILGR